MINLTNRLVQDNLYLILNLTTNPSMWTCGNYKGEHQLAVKGDDNSTTYYPYETKEALDADYKEILRIKKLLNK